MEPTSSLAQSTSQLATHQPTFDTGAPVPQPGPQSPVVLSGAAEPTAGPPPGQITLSGAPDTTGRQPRDTAHQALTFRQRVARRFTRVVTAIFVLPFRTLRARNRREVNIPQEPHPERQPPSAESTFNGPRPNLGPAMPVVSSSSGPPPPNRQTGRGAI